jgi:putative transposase
MGEVGTSADNAAMESFFALVQKNVLTVAGGSPDRTCASLQ